MKMILSHYHPDSYISYSYWCDTDGRYCLCWNKAVADRRRGQMTGMTPNLSTHLPLTNATFHANTSQTMGTVPLNSKVGVSIADACKKTFSITHEMKLKLSLSFTVIINIVTSKMHITSFCLRGEWELVRPWTWLDNFHHSKMELIFQFRPINVSDNRKFPVFIWRNMLHEKNNKIKGGKPYWLSFR